MLEQRLRPRAVAVVAQRSSVHVLPCRGKAPVPRGTQRFLRAALQRLPAVRPQALAGIRHAVPRHRGKREPRASAEAWPRPSVVLRFFLPAPGAGLCPLGASRGRHSAASRLCLRLAPGVAELLQQPAAAQPPWLAPSSCQERGRDSSPPSLGPRAAEPRGGAGAALTVARGLRALLQRPPPASARPPGEAGLLRLPPVLVASCRDTGGTSPSWQGSPCALWPPSRGGGPAEPQPCSCSTQRWQPAAAGGVRGGQSAGQPSPCTQTPPGGGSPRAERRAAALPERPWGTLRVQAVSRARSRTGGEAAARGCAARRWAEGGAWRVAPQGWAAALTWGGAARSVPRCRAPRRADPRLFPALQTIQKVGFGACVPCGVETRAASRYRTLAAGTKAQRGQRGPSRTSPSDKPGWNHTRIRGGSWEPPEPLPA